MIDYELHAENAYGNDIEAIFRELDKLLKYVEDNPSKPKHKYFVIVVETTRIRRNINLLRIEMQT